MEESASSLRPMGRAHDRSDWPTSTAPEVGDSPSRFYPPSYNSPRQRRLQISDWLSEIREATEESARTRRLSDLFDMEHPQLIVWDDDQEALRVDLGILDQPIAGRHMPPEAAALVDEVQRSGAEYHSSRHRSGSGSSSAEGAPRRDSLRTWRAASMVTLADRLGRGRRQPSCRRKESRGVLVSRFPVVKFEGPAAIIGPQECAICLANFSEGQHLRLAPCGASTPHVFHEACAASWFRNHNSCPMCRARVRTPATAAIAAAAAAAAIGLAGLAYRHPPDAIRAPAAD